MSIFFIIFVPHKNIKSMNEIINNIQKSLTDDLLKSKYRKTKKNHLSGHCYVATEALYHLLGDDKVNYIPSTLKIDDITHWFLKNKKTGEIIDPTKDQFDYPLDYSGSRNRFFLTNKPSKRTLILLNRIYEKNNN